MWLPFSFRSSSSAAFPDPQQPRSTQVTQAYDSTRVTGSGLSDCGADDAVRSVDCRRGTAAWSELCLSKTPKYLSRRELYLFPNSSFDAYFSRCTARRPGFGRPFTGRTPTGELGLASANQCSSPLPQETTEIELRRSPLRGLPLPPLARLALHVSHRETGNRRGLASAKASGYSGLGRFDAGSPVDLAFPARSET